MAKTNISFDNKNYSIDDASLSSATTALRQHLSTTMNGTGATIGLGGTNYNIDSAKLSTATNAFVSHLGTISGDGHKVVVNGVEYSVDSNKLGVAIADLHTVLGGLHSGGSDRPDYTPYWGEIYSITFLDGFTRCKDEYRVYEDGSVRNEYYENGEYVEDRYFPSGTLTYIGSEVFIDGTLLGETGMILFATMSKDGTQITMVDNGDVYTLQEQADTPDEERLEGDGAEFYTLAPTALSFRSTAPLNELQEIQINGVTVDPANYTLEEGSTIVTFPIDYLKTLDVGSYEVAVASDSKTVKGDFSVKAPGLNEHGFYYNQPYGAYVDYFGATAAFFLREDDTLDAFVGSSSETCAYTISGNSMTVTSASMGELHLTFSDDGSEAYNTELATNFVLGNESIAADNDYIYIYDKLRNGYTVNAIDKSKAEYGLIKTGVNGYRTVKLADYMFKDNTNLLTAPVIPDGVTEIGYYAFQWCSNMTSVELPDSVTEIGNYAFDECRSLTSINIPDSVTVIGEGAFRGCENMASVTIPDGITSIFDYAFRYCKSLKSVIIPDGVFSIGAYSFNGCENLTSVTFADNSQLRVIGEVAFSTCNSLQNITIPDSVTSIEGGAFEYCYSLTSVTIGNSVTAIGDYAFTECKKLTSITFAGTVTQWNAITIGDCWNHLVPATYVQCSDGTVAL